MTSIVTILRDLWRLRLAVLVVFAIALLVGLAVAFRLPSLESRQDKVGVATVRVLVDTPTPQIVDIAPKGAETLVGRTTLLASLMVDGVVKDAIARRAGLRPSELQSDPSVVTGDPQGEPPDPGEYGLSTRVILSGASATVRSGADPGQGAGARPVPALGSPGWADDEGRPPRCGERPSCPAASVQPDRRGHRGADGHAGRPCRAAPGRR